MRCWPRRLTRLLPDWGSARPLFAGYHHVIQEPEAYRPGGCHQFPSSEPVGQAGLRITRWVIVRHRERAAVMPQHRIEYLADR